MSNPNNTNVGKNPPSAGCLVLVVILFLAFALVIMIPDTRNSTKNNTDVKTISSSSSKVVHIDTVSCKPDSLFHDSWLPLQYNGSNLEDSVMSFYTDAFGVFESGSNSCVFDSWKSLVGASCYSKSNVRFLGLRWDITIQFYNDTLTDIRFDGANVPVSKVIKGISSKWGKSADSEVSVEVKDGLNYKHKDSESKGVEWPIYMNTGSRIYSSLGYTPFGTDSIFFMCKDTSTRNKFSHELGLYKKYYSLKYSTREVGNIWMSYDDKYATIEFYRNNYHRVDALAKNKIDTDL